MTSLMLLFISLLSAPGGLVDVHGTAVWQVRESTVVVRRGFEFSVTCVVTSLTPVDVVRLVLERPVSPVLGETMHVGTESLALSRDSADVSARMLTWTVADNYDVKEPFASLPRYRLYYSYKDGVATSTLTYRGIEGRDAGVLSCGKLGVDDRQRATLNITVLVAVSEVFVATLRLDGGSWRRVSLSQDNTSSVGGGSASVTLRRGRQSGVACVAVADNACDGASLRSLRAVVRHVAVDRRFVHTVETVLKSPPALHGSSDLPGCRTTAVSWYRTWSAPATLNGRLLTCVTGNQLSASALLIVEYAPVITCPPLIDVQSVNLGRSLIVSCDVESYPASSVRWRCCGIDRDIPDSVLYMKVKHGDVVQVSLIIISVNSSTHLGRYTLTASNVAGTAAGDVTVQLMTSSSASSQSDVTEHDTVLVTDSALLQRPVTEHQQLTELHRASVNQALNTASSVNTLIALSTTVSRLMATCRRRS